MSRKLYLRSTCQVLLQDKLADLMGTKDSQEDRTNYVFTVSKDGQKVELRLLRDGQTIEGNAIIVDFDPDLIRILETPDVRSLKCCERERLGQVSQPIGKAIRQLVGLIKQEHGRFDVDDELIGQCENEWSLDGGEWLPTPYGLRVTLSISGLGNVNDRTADRLQELLACDEEPMIATGYLHQAIRSRNARYKWIYATVAAELAIKETLVRIEPKLETLLTEVPSPPLRKLYGVVLESVAGVKFTHLNKLNKGVERRNALLHRVKDEPLLSSEEVNDYVAFIEETIRWLLELRRSMRNQMTP